jgi:hypothetical protein
VLTDVLTDRVGNANSIIKEKENLSFDGLACDDFLQFQCNNFYYSIL